jgi:hypothetical protein
MRGNFLYRVTLADGTTREKLSYVETLEIMTNGGWDYVYIMKSDTNE